MRGRAGERSAKDMAVITGTRSLTNLSQASVSRDLKLNCERRNTLTDELINKALGLTYLFPVKPENVAIMFSHSQAYSELFHQISEDVTRKRIFFCDVMRQVGFRMLCDFY